MRGSEACSNGKSNTVFEVNGCFFFFKKKSGLPSQACGREQFLPKPTCFHEVHCRQSIRAKTSMSRGVVLVDHLFHRNITPVHVAKWLIPRFVTSKSSHSYILLCGGCLPKWSVRRQNVLWQLRRSWCDDCSYLVAPEAGSSSVFRISSPY